MNKLKNATCYLCGAMDRVDDGGRFAGGQLRDFDRPDGDLVRRHDRAGQTGRAAVPLQALLSVTWV